jgi:hypothetical protein
MTRLEKLDRCLIVCVLKREYGDVEILAKQAIEEKRKTYGRRKKKTRETLGQSKEDQE